MRLIFMLAFCLLPSVAFATTDPLLIEAINTPSHSDAYNLWLMISGMLVIFMTIPGLALVYGGLVRYKNVMSIIAQCFAIAMVMIVMWILFGYSLALGHGGRFDAFIGGFHDTIFNHLNPYYSHESAKHLATVLLQMGFAVITPVIIVGGFAERMKFSTIIAFSILWEIFVYYPICHWIWSPGGWLEQLGALDFAGGSVVHINSGVAGLVAALMVGRRFHFKKKGHDKPHNLTLAVIGTGILWFGWNGFNGGSASTIPHAVLAVVLTQVSASAGAVTWFLSHWIRFGKPNVSSLLYGLIAGLVGITPAAGFVGPLGALVIGITCGGLCSMVSDLKYWFNFDDALDAFSLHGFGGILGGILTGIFAARALGGIGEPDQVGILHQVGIQVLAIVAVIIWSVVFTYIILRILRPILGLRESFSNEKTGLDASVHGETAYDTEVLRKT